MSDYCKQCSSAIFGEPGIDLADLITPEEETEGLCVTALCEGCGPIRVDIEGNCLEYDCMRHGHNDLHRAWIEQKTGRKP